MHRLARCLAGRGVRGVRVYWGIADAIARAPAVATVTVHGHARVVVPTHESMARETYRGVGDRAEFAVIEALLSQGGVAVDVGANIGVYTAVLADIVGAAGRVAAFEPSPRVLPTLYANTAPFPGVTVFDCALSTEPGEAALYGVDDERHSGLATLRRHTGAAINAVQVRVARPEDVLRERCWSRIDFLKIDVEGHDAEVVRGFSSWLSTGRVLALQVEVSPAWGGHDVFDAVEEAAPNAYVAFAVRERGRLRLRPALVPVLSPSAIDRQTNVFFVARQHAQRVAQRFSPAPR